MTEFKDMPSYEIADTLYEYATGRSTMDDYKTLMIEAAKRLQELTTTERWPKIVPKALTPKPPLTIRQWLERYLDARGIEIHPTSGSKVTEEAQELVDAIAEYRADPTIDRLYHVYHEFGDVILATAGVARSFDVALEDCVDLKIERDRGRGYKSHADKLITENGGVY